MINIDEVKRFVDFLANKHQSGSVSPDEFNIGAKVANMSLFKKSTGYLKNIDQDNPSHLSLMR